MQTTRKHPRTMQEAFGPYTNNTLHPMKDRRERMNEIEEKWFAMFYVVLFCLVFAGVIAGLL